MPTPKPADPIRDRRHIRAIKDHLKARDKRVELLLFTIAINSGLRVEDLLQLKIGDIWDLDGKPTAEFSIRAQKTGALAVTQINQAIQTAMNFAKPALPINDLDQPLFATHRRSVSRWVKQWAHAVGIDTGNYSAHSLRKTFAYQLWLEQGKTDEALVIVSKALGHKNTGVTMDYIGIRREQIAEWQSELNL
jgi:integrase